MQGPKKLHRKKYDGAGPKTVGVVQCKNQCTFNDDDDEADNNDDCDCVGCGGGYVGWEHLLHAMMKEMGYYRKIAKSLK